MPRVTFFNLSRKLGFVELVDTILYSWTQGLKAWDVRRQYSTYIRCCFLGRRQKRPVQSINGSCFKEFTARFTSKKHRLCWSWNTSDVICCIVTSKNIKTCKMCSTDRRAGYILDMYIKTIWLCVLISYFGSVYLQEFFLKGELLAGIFFFKFFLFFAIFLCRNFFGGNCQPPLPWFLMVRPLNQTYSTRLRL